MEFWTFVGARLLRIEGHSIPVDLPEPYRNALSHLLTLPPDGPCRTFIGEWPTPRKARYIHEISWSELRGLGFSRPARVHPWPGVPLLLLARRQDVCAIAQSFGPRVPPVLRSLALVGKSAALRCRLGLHMLIIVGSMPEAARAVLETGRVCYCSPDRIGEAVGWLTGAPPADGA